jgi:hypothetical protein
MPSPHIKLPTIRSTCSQAPLVYWFKLAVRSHAYNDSGLRKFPQQINIELALERDDELR